MIRPVARRILAPTNDGILVPAVARTHVARQVTHRQIATATAGPVGFRSVEDPVAVQGSLTGLEFKRNRSIAIALRVVDGLAENVVLFRRTAAKGNARV